MYYKELKSYRSGSLPIIVKAETEMLQARFVVQKILELREEGIPLDDIGVLFRSGFLSDVLEVELMKANIPFVKYGGFKFIETAHIKDLIAYLRVLQNPKDVVSWNRILLLIEGIGPRKAESIIDDIVMKRIGSHDASEEFWKRFNDYPKQLEPLFALFKETARISMPVPEKVFHIIEYYTPIFKHVYDDHNKRQKDLEMFGSISEQYDSVEQLLVDLALDPPTNSISEVESPGSDEEVLVLSTVHSAKGLEWKAVFIINALDGRFPSLRSVDDPDELEEEARLFYVACTRAKDYLFITYPMEVFERSSGVVLSMPSRFLNGLKEGQVEEWIVDASIIENPLLGGSFPPATV
ncbi:MAG TPA: 3'-5' exonuclease [Bacteroidota bacterium]|nr:3'-5' exonuclease [Bacteroidota bacterium]